MSALDNIALRISTFIFQPPLRADLGEEEAMKERHRHGHRQRKEWREGVGEKGRHERQSGQGKRGTRRGLEV